MDIEEIKMVDLIDKANLIIKVSQEEWNVHRERIKKIEEMYKVNFNWDESLFLQFDIEDYPNEKDDAYAFDIDEWLDEEPKSPVLRGMMEKYSESYKKAEKNIIERCQLYSLDGDECSVDFGITNGIHLVSFGYPKEMKDLKLKIYGIIGD